MCTDPIFEINAKMLFQKIDKKNLAGPSREARDQALGWGIMAYPKLQQTKIAVTKI